MNNPKWGQPQAVAGGEPVDRVFIVATGEEHEGEATYTRYDHVPPPLCDSECLYAAPPPQAVLEPLTDDQVVGIIASIAKNAARQPILFAVALARAIEAAHGIKGDSHGLPT